MFSSGVRLSPFAKLRNYEIRYSFSLSQSILRNRQGYTDRRKTITIRMNWIWVHGVTKLISGGISARNEASFKTKKESIPWTLVLTKSWGNNLASLLAILRKNRWFALNVLLKWSATFLFWEEKNNGLWSTHFTPHDVLIHHYRLATPLIDVFGSKSLTLHLVAMKSLFF